MKKALILIFISQFLIFLLVGCNSISSSSISRSVSSSPSIASEGNDSSAPIIGDLKLAGSPAGAGPYVSSDLGFYQLDMHSGGYDNILYSDYSSLEQVYLCNRPDCLHNDKSCTSYVDANDSILPGLLYCDPYLLIVTPTGGEHTLPNIQRLDLNGNNKKLLVEFPSTSRLLGAFYTDEIQLIAVRENVINEATAEYDIIAVNLESGQVKTLLTLEDSSSSICGAVGNYLILKKTNIQNGKCSLIRLNLSDPSHSEEIISWNMVDGIENITDSILFLYYPKTNSFSRTDLETGKKYEYQSSILVDNIGLFHMVGGTYEHQLLFDISTPASENHDAYVQRYMVNFESNSIAEISLFDNRNRPITPVDELADNLICIVGYPQRHLLVPDASNPESLMDIISYSPQLARISKEDYLLSNENYTYFKSIE